MKVSELYDALEGIIDGGGEELDVVFVQNGNMTYASSIAFCEESDCQQRIKTYYGGFKDSFVALFEGHQIGMYGERGDWGEED